MISGLRWKIELNICSLTHSLILWFCAMQKVLHNIWWNENFTYISNSSLLPDSFDNMLVVKRFLLLTYWIRNYFLGWFGCVVWCSAFFILGLFLRTYFYPSYFHSFGGGAAAARIIHQWALNNFWLQANTLFTYGLAHCVHTFAKIQTHASSVLQKEFQSKMLISGTAQTIIQNERMHANEIKL